MKDNGLIKIFGRAPGFMALAVIQTGIAAWLANTGSGDLAGFADALLPINLGVYGGGAAKVVASYMSKRPAPPAPSS
jgi:hypothetical protein